jgi:hypothetical protein
MSAEENQSEFLFLQVHVIPTISEKPIAFVELKKASRCQKNDFASVFSQRVFRDGLQMASNLFADISHARLIPLYLEGTAIAELAGKGWCRLPV